MSDKGIILNGLEMDVREYANLEKKQDLMRSAFFQALQIMYFSHP
jgi:hypothetical protein